MNAFQYLARNWPEVSQKVLQHLGIVGVAVAGSLVIGLLLGIVVSRPRLRAVGNVVIAITGVAQSIPSIAVIALIFVYTGIGPRTAIIALMMYGVVPILFNVSSAMVLVPPDMREAAMGMGMTPLQVLMRVELPLAAQSIMAGLRTTVTIDVSTATVASVVGAGGIGDIIFIGLSVVRPDMIIAGTLLVACIAILSDLLLALFQKSVVSRGLSASSQEGGA
jgi:osmoprotectant transport system permease protein